MICGETKLRTIRDFREHIKSINHIEILEDFERSIVNSDIFISHKK